MIGLVSRIEREPEQAEQRSTPDPSPNIEKRTRQRLAVLDDEHTTHLLDDVERVGLTGCDGEPDGRGVAGDDRNQPELAGSGGRSSCGDGHHGERERERDRGLWRELSKRLARDPDLLRRPAPRPLARHERVAGGRALRAAAPRSGSRPRSRSLAAGGSSRRTRGGTRSPSVVGPLEAVHAEVVAQQRSLGRHRPRRRGRRASGACR